MQNAYVLCFVILRCLFLSLRICLVVFQGFEMRFFKFFICFWILKLCECDCYGTRLCEGIAQNHIRPDGLSKEICFEKEILFSMGTDEPIFKSDGEAPAKEVKLEPFCMDLTAVSNLQFLQFVQETKYRTEVNCNQFLQELRKYKVGC